MAFSAFPSSLIEEMGDEDKSLDDFFAKKDKGKKGKSKGKGKFTTSSAMTKQVDKAQKPANEQAKEQRPTANQLANIQVNLNWSILIFRTKVCLCNSLVPIKLNMWQLS